LHAVARRFVGANQSKGPADPTLAVLQYCASGADKFYLITTASQTVSAFNSIGTSLSKSGVAMIFRKIRNKKARPQRPGFLIFENRDAPIPRKNPIRTGVRDFSWQRPG